MGVQVKGGRDATMTQPFGNLFNIDTLHQQIGGVIVSEAMEGETFRHLMAPRDEVEHLHTRRHICHWPTMIEP